MYNVDNIEICKGIDRIELVNGMCLCVSDEAVVLYSSIKEAEQQIKEVSRYTFPPLVMLQDTWPLNCISMLDSRGQEDLIELSNGYAILIRPDILALVEPRFKSLRDFRDKLAKSIFGMTHKQAILTGLCIHCKEPALPKCSTKEGVDEYTNSGVREVCFDKMFKEDDE